MIIGDANLSEISTYLKVGTTALVLAMIEDKFLTVDLSVEEPVSSLRAVSHDASLKHLLTLRSGRTLTAVQLQMEYLEQARKYVEDRFGDNVDAQTADVLDRWESVLTRLEQDPMLCATELDWVAKLRLLEGYRSRDGLGWGSSRLQLVDLQYSDVRPEKGLYARLVARGAMQRLLDRGPGRRGRGRRPRGHQGVLPRRVPAPLPVPGRGRLLGLGDLRPGPRVAGPGAHPGTAARHQGPRGRAAGPFAHGGRARGGALRRVSRVPWS